MIAGRNCKLAFQTLSMPKWITAIFALFLSIQVFGARGKAVDKFLGSCFNAKKADRLQQPVPQKSSGYYRIRSARKTKLTIFTRDFLPVPEPPIVNPENRTGLKSFQPGNKY